MSAASSAEALLAHEDPCTPTPSDTGSCQVSPPYPGTTGAGVCLDTLKVCAFVYAIGNANCLSHIEPVICVALSAVGNSTGTRAAVSVLGEASCHEFLCVAVSGVGGSGGSGQAAISGQGKSAAYFAALSGVGDSDGGFFSVSGIGDSQSMTAISGVGRADACQNGNPCNQYVNYVAVSGVGASQGGTAVSGAGDSAGIIAISGAGHANGSSVSIGGCDIVGAACQMSGGSDGTTEGVVCLPTGTCFDPEPLIGFVGGLPGVTVDFLNEVAGITKGAACDVGTSSGRILETVRNAVRGLLESLLGFPPLHLGEVFYSTTAPAQVLVRGIVETVCGL